MDLTKRSPTDSRVVDRLIDVAAARAGDLEVEDVRIGLAYTAVKLEDGSAGAAYTFHDATEICCSFMPGDPTLAGRRAAELVGLLASTNPIDAAVGLATSNALTNREGAGAYVDGDVVELLDLGPEDDVAMIGHFAPVVGRLEKRVRSLRIFERTDEPRGRIRPTTEAPAVLADSSVALITATSLLNGTAEALLEAARSCRAVALLGATTPLVPEAFRETPVTLLTGVVVQQADDLLRSVSEACGMPQFKRFVRKVGLPVA